VALDAVPRRVDWLPSQSGAGEQGTADSRSDPHVGTSQPAVTVEQWCTVVHRAQSNFRRQPNLSGTKPPRSGPVNRSTRSEPTADLWDTFYLVVFPTFRGTSSFRKPSAKCFTRSARCRTRPLEAATQSLQVLPCGSSRTPVNLATTPPVGGRTCSLCSLRRPRSESPDGSQRLREPPPLAHSSSRPEGGSHTRHGHNGAKSVNVSRRTGR